MKDHLRPELRISLILFFILVVVNVLFKLPEFFMGVIAAVAFLYAIIGILPEKTYTAIKQWKK
ncbi:hypothetical protein ACR6HW_02955 [Fusibacter sp. JL298sf-3]